MKRCKFITCWTDYPFGDAPTIIRHVQVLCYDGNKYATVQDLATGEIEHIKAGYLYCKPQAMKFVPWATSSVHKPQAVGASWPIRYPWVQRPKQVNPRKLERMVPQIID